MAKRFGRNQRRKMQAQHAQIMLQAAGAMNDLARRLCETQAALLESLGGDYRLPDGEEVWEIPRGNVHSWNDTTDYQRDERGGYITRTASVTLIEFSPTEKLMEALHDRHYRGGAMVAFHGIRWAIDEIRADAREVDYGIRTVAQQIGGMAFVVRLRAIAKARS